jgi:hypothetical protein
MWGIDPVSDPHRVLGVAPDATQAEVRAAYLRLAKQHHPDGGTGDTARMAAINEAWAALRAGPAPRRLAPETDHVAPRRDVVRPLPPARIPWRFMGGMAAAGMVLVVIGAATADRTKRPEQPDRIMQVGSCVDLDARGEAVEVSCNGPHRAVVTRLVGEIEACPAPTERYRDTQGLGWVCVVTAE